MVATLVEINERKHKIAIRSCFEQDKKNEHGFRGKVFTDRFGFAQRKEIDTK